MNFLVPKWFYDIIIPSHIILALVTLLFLFIRLRKIGNVIAVLYFLLIWFVPIIGSILFFILEYSTLFFQKKAKRINQ